MNEDGTIEIRIKSPTVTCPNNYSLAVDRNSTVLQLKSKIRETLSGDILESSQKLIFAGHILDDAKRLSDLNLTGSVTFHLVTVPGEPQRQPDEQASTQPISATTEQQPDDTFTDPIFSAPSTTGGSESSTFTSSQTQAQPPIQVQAQPLMIAGRVAIPLPIMYQTVLIDNFPYLVQTPQLPPQMQVPIPMHVPIPTPTHMAPSLANFGRTGPFGQPPHHHLHQVHLPASTAMPVTTASGQRALILSPEGVRAMAAQGVHVQTSPRRTLPSLLSLIVALIARIRTGGMGHTWLFLKLAIVVGMLSANTTWTRFFVINFCATFIFLWQTRVLAAFYRGWGDARQRAHPNGANGGGTGNAVNAGATDTTGVGGELRRDAPHDDGNLPDQGGNMTELNRGTPLLRNLGRAFLGSIVPGTVLDEQGDRDPVQPPPLPQDDMEVNA